MDTEFWKKAWNEGRTNFHRENVHEQLTEYFVQLKPGKGQKVLVPLCGKSKDLIWLNGLGLRVHGIELHEQAVESFFVENDLAIAKTTQGDFTNYTHEDIVISCGDFFKLDADQTYDFVYDRASLVALPSEMRRRYAQIVKRALKKGGKCLLIVYEYDQSKMDGPPFSVDTNEIQSLYADQFTIKLMQSKQATKEGPRLSALDTIKENVYILERKE